VSTLDIAPVAVLLYKTGTFIGGGARLVTFYPRYSVITAQKRSVMDHTVTLPANVHHACRVPLT